MADEIDVDTADLRAKADQLDNVRFGDGRALSSGLVAPDALASTRAAVRTLQANTDYLAAHQRYAQAEGRRLAEALRSVGDAYDEFDEAARRSVDGTGPPPVPVLPKAISIPKPELPAPLVPPVGPPDEEALHVDVAQQMLTDGDGGTSLVGAKLAWDANGLSLVQAATVIQAPIRNWEGRAADAAYRKSVDYGVWLTKLGESWHVLAQQADHIAQAHHQAIADHTPVFQQYETLLADVGVGNQVAAMAEMQELQHASEHIRLEYANATMLQQVTVDPPPAILEGAFGADGGGPRRLSSDRVGRQLPSGGAGGDGGGGPARGTPPSAGRVGDERPSGAGGASPAGGGVPAGSGGPPDGRIPGLPNASDRDVTNPSVDPAAVHAGAGRGGGGGGAGGTRGGTPSIPLGPSVGGVSVDPGVASHVNPGGATPGGGGAIGGAMGGIGGGAPMSGHGRSEGKEKRRTPTLSPDEALYVEDRDYTEEVIGARPRRTPQGMRDTK